ncbi:carbohydrate sulfotransferase 10-like [Watersipora subatra]|uniref:carbohydrate sulfotransferase 10-like n=1 Tax=Watersipora subatra TaxID=2589382 RepID=UPI00355BF248
MAEAGLNKTAIKVFFVILGSQFLLFKLLAIRRQPKSLHEKPNTIELTVVETPRQALEIMNQRDSYYNTSNYWAEKVKQSCSSHGLQQMNFSNQKIVSFGLPGWVWMISPPHQLFYCAAPKCSSSTWKTYIMEDEGRTWKGNVHVAATEIGLSTLAKEKKVEHDYISFLDVYRPTNRLIIVRNPWARLVSAYQDKIVKENWSLKQLCVEGGRFSEPKPPTFAMFAECLARSNRKVMWNSHIHPFTYLCAICHMDYNIIVRLEDMEVAEPFIFDQLKFKHHPKYQPPAKGVFSNNYSEFYSALPDETISLLAEIYKDDINLFSYPETPFQL